MTADRRFAAGGAQLTVQQMLEAVLPDMQRRIEEMTQDIRVLEAEVDAARAKGYAEGPPGMPGPMGPMGLKGEPGKCMCSCAGKRNN